MVAKEREGADMPLDRERSCRIVRRRGAIANSLDLDVIWLLVCESPPDV
jgi:hypothetical protein